MASDVENCVSNNHRNSIEENYNIEYRRLRKLSSRMDVLQVSVSDPNNLQKIALFDGFQKNSK